MDQLSLRFTGAIAASLLIAFLVTITPLNNWLGHWRPEWIALVIIHWGLFFPGKISYLMVFLVGLLVDAVWGLTLGQHSLTYLILLYSTVRMRERMSPNLVLQQFFLILLVISLYMLVNLWVYGATDKKLATWGYWYPLFTSILVWPLISGLLKRLHVIHRM